MAGKIFVKLTEAEIVERSQKLAQVVCEHEALRLEAKEQAAHYRGLVKELAEEIRELATAVRSGQEERDMQMELAGVRKIKDVV